MRIGLPNVASRRHKARYDATTGTHAAQDWEGTARSAKTMILPGAWARYQYVTGLDSGRVVATLTYSRFFLKFHRGNQTVPHILIVGVGSIGQRHVENFLKVDGVRCSIAEMDETMRQRATDQFPIEQVYDDFRDADLPAFDGVVICTPTNTHVRLATEVVSAGTHVLCEKPLDTSFDGVDELKRARDANGASVGVAFVMRCNPIFEEMKRRLDAGDIGAVYMAHSVATQYWPRMRKDFPPQYAMSRDTGGGAIQDHMVHHINLFEWFFGQPVSVAARHWQLGLGLPTEDTAAVTIEFPNNVVAQLEISLCQQNPAWSVHVAGESSTLRVGCNFDYVDRYDPDTDCWQLGKAKTSGRDSWFHNQAQRFIDMINDEAEPHCTIEEAEQTMRTIMTAHESADGDGRRLTPAYTNS